MQAAATTPPCPVCQGGSRPLGAVDFNRSCEDGRGRRLPPAGRLVHYLLCRDCGFAWAPEFTAWTAADFEREIYNEGYGAVDPDHAEVRPRTNAETLLATFPPPHRPRRHLDYGGGAGRLGERLRAAGWDSTSCDPFFGSSGLREPGDPTGRYALITCFEVFEHVPDVAQLAQHLDTLLAPDGLILASTLLSDGHLVPGQPLTWWYAAPRNGHVSLYSARSLGVLASRQGWNLASFSADIHLFWRGSFPAWAQHLLKAD